MKNFNHISILTDELKEELLSTSPDLTKINSQLINNFYLSTDEASKFIYKVVLEVNKRLFPPITKLEIFHTEACNLACKYCFENKIHSPKNISTETAYAAVDLLFDYAQDDKDLEILHFGGEPTLNFLSIKKITEYAFEKALALRKNIKFGMTSNGVLINKEMADYFAKYKIHVLLSIDGLESSHNRFRVDKFGHGSYAEAVKAIELLKQTQKWIGIKMTVMPQNIPDMVSDVLGLYKMGINQFLISPATGIKWSKEEMIAYAEQYALLYEWYKNNKNINLRIAEFDDLEKDNNYLCFGCRAGRNSIVVSVNGEISPCSKMLGLDRNHLVSKLGDVHFGITHIQNRYALMYCPKLLSSCKEKGIVIDYPGGCYATNFEENKDIFNPSTDDYHFKKIIKNSCLKT